MFIELPADPSRQLGARALLLPLWKEVTENYIPA